MRTFTTLFLLLLVGALHAAAAPGQATEPLKVVTTFTILQDMAREVAGERAVVESITKPGAEIHDYETTPGDLVKAKGARLILWNGLGLERWFDRFYQRLGDVPSAVLTEGIEPIGIGEGPYSGRPNPHAWMSPKNALVYIDNIRAALTRVDPEGAAHYRARAEAYQARIVEVDTPAREALAGIPEGRRWLVTSEGAFSYLARDYGFREIYLWPINADEEGTPRQVRRVIDLVRQHQVPVVFSESTVSDKPARQVAKETGARYGGVLYVDSLTDSKGPAPTFLELLAVNSRTLAAGFKEQP